MAFEKLATTYRMIRHGIPASRVKPSSKLTVADLIEQQAAARGDAPFILLGDQRVSYREFNEQANRVARWGLSVGLQAGTSWPC